jgi:ABC-type lipoprotein export system ATPase subunit
MKILEIKNLKKSYLSPEGVNQKIVDVAHFSLDEKEQVALAGDSGSGKTTFLNMIAGILSPDEGQVVINGQDTTKLSGVQRDLLRAENLGYIFQTFNLLQGYTALENVKLGMMFGPRVDMPYAKQLLERVGLAERFNYLPRQMSVGQQQRVAVARALANHPKLVLADEPTGHLDHGRAMESLDLIRQICKEQGAALLLVSHDKEVLTKFSKIQNLNEINRASSGVGLKRGQK